MNISDSVKCLTAIINSVLDKVSTVQTRISDSMLREIFEDLAPSLELVSDLYSFSFLEMLPNY